MDKKSFDTFGQWEFVESLGSGAFGEVHLWKDTINGIEIAIKRLKSNPKLRQDEICILRKRWLQECQWMQNLRTNFIVGCVNISDTNFLNYLAEQNDAGLSLPVIIMEYCNGGDLRRQLNKVDNLNGLQEYEVRQILFALLRALEYLHNECNIEHRDIKPENIVLHIKGKEKRYKLTDFGYAREIPESTIAQSVVGTRNYVAPEVVDPGMYTKTVDYWSIGVLAYEIICGVHPFIPHQTFFNRMKNIQKKPPQSIAIVQNVDDLNSERFDFKENVPAENHASCHFVIGMEKWLRLALDTNYKTRGNDVSNQLKFYSDLDNLIEKKIVTVFSLKTFKKYHYDMELYHDLSSFHEQICLDNEIQITHIFFIFPPLHPKKIQRNPMDFFVPEWCDTTNPDNPPVMLFVSEYLIPTNCDIEIEKHFSVTDTIQKCMHISEVKDKLENLTWLLQQFERDVHFILTERQNLLECYMMGLKNFLIETEHVVCMYNQVDELMFEISRLSGGVKYFRVVVDEYINIKKEEALKAKETAKILSGKCQELERLIFDQLKPTHKEILQKCRDLTLNQIFEQYVKGDIFELSKYRESLSKNHTAAERLANAQIAFDKCVQKFNKFIKSSVMMEIRAGLLEQIQKFSFLRQRVSNIKQLILSLDSELESFTRYLMKNISDKLAESMGTLHIDGPALANRQLKNYEIDSQQLIEECQSLCNAMEMSMDMN